MFEQDYIMRLIREMVRTMAKLVFKVDIDDPKKIDFENEDLEEEYYNLITMINSGMVNEAENMLLDQLDLSNKKSFEMSLMFYSYLNEKNDDFLEIHNYSRKEVVDGIKNVCDKFGYSGFTESFLGDMLP